MTVIAVVPIVGMREGAEEGTLLVRIKLGKEDDRLMLGEMNAVGTMLGAARSKCPDGAKDHDWDVRTSEQCSVGGTDHASQLHWGRWQADETLLVV